MFTNEFGQTVKADWASFSITSEHLSAISTTAVRSMMRSSDVTIFIESMESEFVFLEGSIEGVTGENREAVERILGFDLIEEDNSFVVNDGQQLVARMFQLLFCDSATYSFDEDGDVIIQMDFDDYIRRTFGL